MLKKILKATFTEAFQELKEEGYFVRFEEKARALKPVRESVHDYAPRLIVKKRP